MKIKIVFNDNESKVINYIGDWSFVQWSEKFFSSRYYVVNATNDKGNMTIDTDKVKYIEII
jgi:hypothetical protein